MFDLVAVLDVGKNENIGKAIWEKDAKEPPSLADRNPIGGIITQIQQNKNIKNFAIGIEAPLFVPTGDITTLTRARRAKCDEVNIDCIDKCSHPWSMTASLCCMIPLLDILVKELGEKIKTLTISTSFNDFLSLKNDEKIHCFIFEAFVSRGKKPEGKEHDSWDIIINDWREKNVGNEHDEDAKTACTSFLNFVSSINPKLKNLEGMDTLNMTKRYLNIPCLFAEHHGVTFHGAKNKGCIIRRSKPYAHPFEDYLLINWGE